MEMIYYLVKRMSWAAILPVILLGSCKKDSQSSTGKPVVQSYLVAGKVLTVRLYTQKTLTDTEKYGPALTGLKPTVSDGTTIVNLTETAKGIYTYADSTFLVSGKTYALSFVYNSVTISAKTVMPAKPQGFATQFTSVDYTSTDATTRDTINRFTWQNPDSLNHVLVFIGLDGASFPVNSFYNGSTNFEEDTKQRSVYYVLPSIFPYYGRYQVLLYSVNQEYINLLKSNASGANSQNLLNTPTNVINGVGIFTAMQADTVSFSFL